MLKQLKSAPSASAQLKTSVRQIRTSWSSAERASRRRLAQSRLSNLLRQVEQAWSLAAR